MKTENTINCPSCHHSFPIEVALATQLRSKIDAELRVGYDARLAKERDSLVRELTRVAQAEANRVNAAKVAELETAAVERDAALKRAQAQLETTRREAAKLAREEFQAERLAMEEEIGRHYEASQEARKEFQTQLSSMDEEFQNQRNELELARATELELRREKSRLEGIRQELEVEAARKLDAERVRLRDELARNLDAERVRVREELASAHSETQKLREAEYAQQTDGLRRQVEELRRKLEAGGEQRRGEVCEVRLEEVLRASFPADTIEAVARGVHGADVRQRVCTPGAKPCGTILYESKHTAAWSARWPAKLRDDQHAERAEVAVLVTAVLPKDITHIALIEGVWVTTPACLPGLALLLRTGLLQLATHRQAVIGRGEKMELVYAYLTGDQFQRHVESLVATYADMSADLVKEKRALTTMWHRRDKQLERVSASITSLYSDLHAIAGAGTLPKLASLELTDLLDEGNRNTTNGRQHQQGELM